MLNHSLQDEAYAAVTTDASSTFVSSAERLILELRCTKSH